MPEQFEGDTAEAVAQVVRPIKDVELVELAHDEAQKRAAACSGSPWPPAG
jgi:hypothetical protein